ncbi:MAG: DAK2 domain-containing protein [Acidobacteria bacterium]|nr:DAK2 domain-containing protein [Acidobacteriota bacterium]
MTAVLGGPELRRAALAALDALRSHQVEIDLANVYPVPDGDTGTNMVLTMESVARAIAGADGPEVAAAVARGSLMGARGNGGVILAQFLRGLCERIGPSGADAHGVAAGLARGAELAREAVLRPVEGTILTVARAAAGALADPPPGVVEVLDRATRAAREARARTPDLLPVLREAGVLDAGGMGLVVVLQAFRDSLAGRVVPVPAALPEARATGPALGAPPARPREMGDPAFAYEVQYLLRATEVAAEGLRESLGDIGDSVAVIGGDGTWRVHVHTNLIGEAIELGVRAGAPSGIEVVAFAGGLGGLPARRAAALVAGAQLGIPLARAASRAAVVAVATGEGARGLFREAGCEAVVDGGPTINPSVGELLTAIEAVPADDVILLPNDPDAWPAAEQAAARSAKRVEVVLAPNMAAGLAAAMAYGDARPLEANVADMRRALERTPTGRVAVANRSASTAAGPVRGGDAIGFAGGEPVVVSEDPVEACAGVAERLAEGPVETLTVLAGLDAGPEERARLAEALSARLPGLDVEILDGGQGVQRYLLASE